MVRIYLFQRFEKQRASNLPLLLVSLRVQMLEVQNSDSQKHRNSSHLGKHKLDGPWNQWIVQMYFHIDMLLRTLIQ